MTSVSPGSSRVPALPGPFGDDCAWWNLACQGGDQIVDAGMSAITRAIAAGAHQLLNEIVEIVDASTQVPLEDPAYQDIYLGFLGLGGALIAVVLCVALLVAALRRDTATLGRAVTGLLIAGLGGAVYIVLAQLLVGLDNWLAQGVVRVTRRDLGDGLSELADGFGEIGGMPTQVAGNMLLIVLMMLMLLAALVLWFVLVLRQIAILVVVAFAPLLIAGYLWAPTRSWVRRATEVVIALIFTKTAIYAVFGIGLALLVRDDGQTLSGFVGSLVLVIGASFTPLLMLRLVHFAADTNIAGDMIGTLSGGMNPVVSHLPSPHLGTGGGSGREELANSSTRAPADDTGMISRAGAAGPRVSEWSGTSGAAGGTGAAGAGPGGVAGASGTAAAGVAAGAAGAAAVGVAAAQTAGSATQHVATGLANATNGTQPDPGRHRSDPQDLPPLAGPPASPADPSDDRPPLPGPASEN